MATGPINYSAMLYAPPDDSLVKSFGQGMQIRQSYSEAEQKALERQRAQEMQRQYQADAQAAMAKPTPQAFAALALKYPQHREAFKQGWDGLSADAQRNELKDATQLSAALSSGRKDVALSMIDQRIGTMKAAGGDTASLDMLRQQVEADPQRAYGSLMHIVSGLPGGDKILEGLGKIGAEQRAVAGEQRTAELHPAAVLEGQAKAQSAVVGAKFAESKAVQDLRMGEEQIKKWGADTEIARMNSRISAMNAATNRADSDLKRQELGLKLQEAVSKRDDKLREKSADFQAGHAVLADAMRLVSEIKSNKVGLAGATGGTSWGSFVPGTPSADAAAKIEQLENILAAANLDKLKGPMSDKDIVFLKRISANLNRKQSSEQFMKELDQVEEAVVRNEKILRSRFGSAATPVSPSAPSGSAPANRGITVDW